MRITNKIMQNNSLSNINNTKIAEDKLSNQVSSGKKIVRPSDDPIIAIRALRLRSSVTEIKQYFERNVKDADAWLNTTADAVENVGDVITDMIKQYEKGADEYLTSKDRGIILEQLRSLKEEVYSTGNADYAGRYIFTGYRTESPLMFTKDTAKTYTITEQITAAELKTDKHVNTCYVSKTTTTTTTNYYDAGGDLLYVGTKVETLIPPEDPTTTETYEKQADGSAVTLADITADTNVDATKTVVGAPQVEKEYSDLANLQEGTQQDYRGALETDISKTEYHRIRLSYEKCDEAEFPEIQYYDKASNTWQSIPGATYQAKTAKSTDVPSPYDNVGEDDVIYIANTGEVLLGKNAYEELSKKVDDPLTDNVHEGEIRVTYQKTNFKDGDLKPEHYFYCKAENDAGKLLEYNPGYLEHNKPRQVIEYDVGFDQRLQVNTIAEEAFDPDVEREVDDMIRFLEDVQRIEDVITTLKGMKDKITDKDELAIIDKQIAAANKAYTYEKENLQQKFEKGISIMQGFLNDANMAATNCGTRGSRLALVETRLCSQKTTFENLKSENEDVDLSEAVVHLTSAEMTYEAALKATGMMMKTNLMDFI